jgi:hypothetical protein
MAQSSGATGRDMRIVVCAVASLAVPLWWYFRLYQQFQASLDPQPGWVATGPFSADHLRQGWRLVFRAGLIGDCVVALVLSLLACLYLRWRIDGGNKASVGVRVAADVSLLFAVFLSPWLAQGVGSFSPPRGNPIDDWFLFRNGSTALPALAAGASALLYLASRRLSRAPRGAA